MNWHFLKNDFCGPTTKSKHFIFALAIRAENAIWTGNTGNLSSQWELGPITQLGRIMKLWSEITIVLNVWYWLFWSKRHQRHIQLHTLLANQLFPFVLPPSTIGVTGHCAPWLMSQWVFSSFTSLPEKWREKLPVGMSVWSDTAAIRLFRLLNARMFFSSEKTSASSPWR